MSDIIYQRILEGFPEQLYHAVSYASGYSKRGMVLTTPERDDVVIIDPWEGMVWPPKELAMQNRLGLGPKPENILLANFDSMRSWKENVSNNKELFAVLNSKKFTKLRAFTGKSVICHSLASTLGVPCDSVSEDIAHWAEANQTLQEFGSRYGFSPRGFTVTSNDDILMRYRELLDLSGFSGLAVLKAKQAASGVVSTVVSSEKELSHFLEKFDYRQLGGGVIQEWLDSDIRSPSINYTISPDRGIVESFISDQLFENAPLTYGSEGTRVHRGNVYPTTLSEEIQEEIRKKTMAYARALKKKGYYGLVGFDTIVLNSPVPKYYGGARVLITEINPRMTGPRFAHYPMQLLDAKAFRLRNEHVTDTITIETLEDVLRPILFSKDSKEGFVPFNVFPGKFTGLALAPTKERLTVITEKIDSVLKGLR